jgi:hypothetical protein
MNRIRVFLSLSALLAGLGSSLAAEEPLYLKSFAGQENPRAGSSVASHGTVLILKNQQVLEGEIDQVGDFYRVRKGKGELTVPASEGLRLCGDWDDALAYMRSRIKLSDPDERLRLARWCQMNRQLDRARDEAQLALELRPKHAETVQFLNSLEITTLNKPAVKPVAPPPTPPPPQVDLTFEAVTAFNMRVQPILMNTCVNCHAGSYSGKFRLHRLHEGGERAATQRNLAVVMAQINLEKPAASPLLVMALSAHGGAKTSPIAGKQAPAFFALCIWIDQTLADNPHLLNKAAPVPLPVPVSLVKAPELSGAVPKIDAKVAPKPSADPLPGVVVSKDHTAPVAVTPLPQPPMTHPPTATKTIAAPVVNGPRGEYDPGEFNDWAHPNKK